MRINRHALTAILTSVVIVAAETGSTSPLGLGAKIERVRRFDPGTRVGTIACSQDGELIAVGNDSPSFTMLGSGRSRVNDGWHPSARILDATTGTTTTTLQLVTPEEKALLTAAERVPIFEVSSLAFSPDASVLAVGTTAGQVKVFDARSGKLLRTLDDAQGKEGDAKTTVKSASFARAIGSARTLAFSPDGNLLAVGGGSFADVPLVSDGVSRLGLRSTGPGRLKLWDVKTGALKRDLVGHSRVSALAFSPDGRLLASAGDWLSSGDWGRGVTVWDLASGGLARRVQTQANGSVWSVAFSPDSKLVAIGAQHFDKDKTDEEASSGRAALVHASSGIMEWVQMVPDLARSVAFSPDGKSIVVLCGRRAVRLLDTDTGLLKGDIELANLWSSSGRWTAALTVAPQSHLFVIGGVDRQKHGCVEVWGFNDPPGGEGGPEPVRALGLSGK